MYKRYKSIRNILLYVLGTLTIVVILPAGILMIMPDQQDTPSQPEVVLNMESGHEIKVYDEATKRILKMDVEDYLVGVVAAEMPATFQPQALEAQAIAARTFAYKRMKQPNPKAKEIAPEADLTTSPATCQAWISEEERKSRWGNNYESYNEKIKQAVNNTKNQVIIYQGELIDPLYHASCGGGKTETAKNVWGGDLPYLQSVACIEHKDRHYGEEKVFSLAQIDQSLGCDLQAVPVGQLKGNNSPIKVLEKNNSERIEKISFAGKAMKGIDVRSLLQLKSTLFTWKINGETITFTTKGYGHGVGMCQYGADALAQQGYSSEQILTRYYTGVEIKTIDN